MASLAKLAAVTALTALLLFAWQAQLIAPATPANTGFSSERAFATLSRLLAEQKPHPAGSPENAVVRDRIVAELTASGYTPEIQTAFQCSLPGMRSVGCSAVENIVAVRKGTGQGKAILATAHYDSVPAGPGVADDGAGTAVMLELARHLAGAPPARNDVIFLITDAEENGLRGALAFAERHPLMKRVGLVVNVEARGNTGPSIMFETGSGNARLIDLFAKTIRRPVSNSLAFEIYRLLDNDTDFSIYKRYDLTGFNFANIGAASRYHSPRDDLAHLDQNTLQHHGDNVFALMAKLADIDLGTLKTEADASYFDIAGQALVVWPAAINLPVSLAALLGIVMLIIVHRRAFSLGAIGWSVLGLISVLAALFAFGWALSYPLGIWPGVHPLDHPEPWPARIALATSALVIAFIVATFIGNRAGMRSVLLVNWLVLGLGAVACAVFLSGASYALVWPAVAVALAGGLETLFGRKSTLAVTAAIGFAATAFFWLAHFLVLEGVLGFASSELKMLVLAPFVLALSPLVASAPRANAPAKLVCTVAIVVTSFIASRATAFTPDRPRPLNIIYYDDRPAGAPRWLINADAGHDQHFVQAQGFPAQDESFRQLGFIPATGRLKSAADLKLAAPSLTVAGIAASGTYKTLTGTLRSGRAGFVMGIAIAPGSGIRALRIDGQDALTPEHLRAKTPIIARLFAMGGREAPIEIVFDPNASAKLVLFERSTLPDSDEARTLTAARPNDAAPVDSGDGALVAIPIDLAVLKPGP